MTKSSLFTNQSCGRTHLSGRFWTNEGRKIASEIKSSIEQIMRGHAYEGYNLRELQNIAYSTIEEIVLDIYINDEGISDE